MLAIPPEVRDWIRLGHYEGLNLVEQRDEDAPSAETVRALRRKYRETLRLHALLEAEKAKNEATIGSLKRIILGQGKGAKKEPNADVEMEGQSRDSGATFAFLGKNGGLGGEGQPLTTTTSFALSQVPALKSLLENLEPRLSDLSNGAEKGTLGEEEKSWKRTRLEFIEKETQRHLENARGLELGEQGAVRDGEWQGEGRTLGKGEVESLEKVVSIIGGATDGDPMDEGA
jgi:kinetochore protein Mis12/MTW1